MNSSIFSADRATHLRIVVAALLASIGMVVFALALHVAPDGRYAAVVRAHHSHQVELSGEAAPVLLPAARRI